MNFGYARVSTGEQCLDRQIDLLKQNDCERIFHEKFTGSTKDRPELDKLIDMLREGDVIIVSELTRLSRSVKDLFDLIDLINQKKSNIRSIKEPWLNTTTPHGKLLFSIFAGISQFDRDLISQRTIEGLVSARARGRNGGRPKKPADEIKLALKMYDSRNYSISEITKATGISKTSLFRYLKRRGFTVKD